MGDDKECAGCGAVGRAGGELKIVVKNQAIADAVGLPVGAEVTSSMWLCNPCMRWTVDAWEAIEAGIQRSTGDAVDRNREAVRRAIELADQVRARARHCGNARCTTPFQNVAERWCQGVDFGGEKTGATLEVSCERCHLLDEAEFAGRTPSSRPTVPAGSTPGRVRPTFADLATIEDCLPEAGR